MNKRQIQQKNKVLEAWADKLRALMTEARDAGVLVTAKSGPFWGPRGPVRVFSISVEYPSDQTDAYLVWQNGDNS